jgi:hypothetical protein
LGERHYSELLGTRQRTHAGVAAVATDDAGEGSPWHELHELSEQGLANVHERSPLEAHRGPPLEQKLPTPVTPSATCISHLGRCEVSQLRQHNDHTGSEFVWILTNDRPVLLEIMHQRPEQGIFEHVWAHRYF